MTSTPPEPSPWPAFPDYQPPAYSPPPAYQPPPPDLPRLDPPEPPPHRLRTAQAITMDPGLRPG